MKTYLAFYKGRKKDNKKATLLDRCICLIDGSPYSHVEFVTIENNTITMYSSSHRDNGVRKRNKKVLNNNRWDLYEIEVPDIKNSIKKFEFFKDAKYDYLGIISTVISWFPHCKNRVFCSELVMLMCGGATASTAHRYGIKKTFEWAKNNQKV